MSDYDARIRVRFVGEQLPILLPEVNCVSAGEKSRIVRFKKLWRDKHSQLQREKTIFIIPVEQISYIKIEYPPEEEKAPERPVVPERREIGP